MELPANTWVFDLEIRNMIPTKDESPMPNTRYCKGWGDHAGMGVSCLVAARPDGSDLTVFCNDLIPWDFKDTTRTLKHLSFFWRLVQEAELLIGYGSRTFDTKVLAALGLHLPLRRHLDILYEIKKAGRNFAPKGYKLNDLSQRCGGPAKSEDGALAPYLWQQGERERVINYCCNDIAMLCSVTQRYALTGGYIPAPDLTPLKLRTPQQIAIEDF